MHCKYPIHAFLFDYCGRGTWATAANIIFSLEAAAAWLLEVLFPPLAGLLQDGCLVCALLFEVLCRYNFFLWVTAVLLGQKAMVRLSSKE